MSGLMKYPSRTSKVRQAQSLSRKIIQNRQASSRRAHHYRTKVAAVQAGKSAKQKQAEDDALIAQALAEGRVTRCPPQTYARPDL